MRPTLQTHAVRRTRPPVNTPAQLAARFIDVYGEEWALRSLLVVAAHPSTLTSHVERFNGAIQILIHRDLSRAMVARSLTGATL